MTTLTLPTSPMIFELLAHDLRWQLLYLLAQSDYRVNELVAMLDRPLNLVSYHLKQLRQHKLISERRSSADRRDLYYHLDIDQLQRVYALSGQALHPAIQTAEISVPQVLLMYPLRLLFVCTHNSARSQIAEGLARTLGQGQITAISAGSQPGRLDPDAIRVMAEHGIDISAQKSKQLEQFCDQSFDYIITVCDQARESCPTFPNAPQQIHWSFPDPTSIDDPAARYQAFQLITRELGIRIRHLILLAQRKETML